MGAGDASKLRRFLRDATNGLVRKIIAFALLLLGMGMSLAIHLYSP